MSGRLAAACEYTGVPAPVSFTTGRARTGQGAPAEVPHGSGVFIVGSIRGEGAGEAPHNDAADRGGEDERAGLATCVALDLREHRTRVPVAEPGCGSRQTPRHLLDQIAGDATAFRVSGHGAELVADRAKTTGKTLLLGVRLLRQLPLRLRIQILRLRLRLPTTVAASSLVVPRTSFA